MKIKDFEAQLKKLDPEFRIVDNSQYGVKDVVGVYWKNTHVATAPANDIFPERNPEYKDFYGQIHRGAGEILMVCKAFIEEMQNDKEIYDLMSEEL